MAPDQKKDFLDRLREVRDSVMRESQLRAARESEENRKRSSLDDRYSDIIQMLWALVQSLAKDSGFCAFRYKTNGYYIDTCTMEHLVIYDPNCTSGPGTYVRVSRSLHCMQVAGVTCWKRQRAKGSTTIIPAGLSMGRSSSSELSIVDLALANMSNEQISQSVRTRVEEQIIAHVKWSGRRL